MNSGPRWLQVAGWSGVGKTTILSQLVTRAKARGEQITSVKFSDHRALTAAGDSAFLYQHGADLSVMVGPDGASWQSSLSRFVSLLIGLKGDWVFVEGGRMLPTPKILLAQDAWPAHVPPVVAGLGPPDGEFAKTLSLTLPQEADRAAAWIDLHRLECSATPEIWIPCIREAFQP